ncbi:hypothetical protein O3P69_001248 [Scylla paramamosain]|uniref:Uncharacterized protein n=1 Tax=Scylla paramamosain TaxID=85552 RepID=A0AAW0US40_SCYPA
MPPDKDSGQPAIPAACTPPPKNMDYPSAASKRTRLSSPSTSELLAPPSSPNAGAAFPPFPRSHQFAGASFTWTRTCSLCTTATSQPSARVLAQASGVGWCWAVLHWTSRLACTGVSTTCERHLCPGLRSRMPVDGANHDAGDCNIGGPHKHITSIIGSSLLQKG